VNSPACPHERDVLDLVAISQWPQRAGDSLREHVNSCESCAEVASIASAVRAWDDAAPRPRVPDASVVWHRAQARARAAATRTASRPVWMAQGAALVAFAAALVWMGPGAGWYASVWQSVMAAMPTASINLPSWPAWPTDLTLASLSAGWGRVALIATGVLVLAVSVVAAALRITERSELHDN
jgi:hypothetical protein